MSVLATEGLSAVGTRQMFSLETGQMSAVETGQMSQQQTSVLLQQPPSVLSQQQTSVLSQHQIYCHFFIQTQGDDRPAASPPVPTLVDLRNYVKPSEPLSASTVCGIVIDQLKPYFKNTMSCKRDGPAASTTSIGEVA